MVNFKKGRTTSIIIIIFLLSLYFLVGCVQLPGVQGLKTTLGSQDNAKLLKDFSFLSLGVMPYIISDMIIQILCSGISPLLSSWKKEGIVGHNKLNKCKYVLMMISAYIFAMINIKNAEFENSYFFIYSPEKIAIFMTVGTVFTIVICKAISKTKLVNGLNLMLFLNIATNIIQNLLDIKDFKMMYLMIFVIALFVIIGLYLDSKRMKIKVNVDNADIAVTDANIMIPYNPIGITPFIFISVIMQFIDNIYDSALVILIYFIISYIIIGIVVGWKNLEAAKRSKMMKLNGIYIVEDEIVINPGKDTLHYLTKAFMKVIAKNICISLIYFFAFTAIASYSDIDISIVSVFLLAMLFEQLYNDILRYKNRNIFETL